jgi:hypothetical protein
MPYDWTYAHYVDPSRSYCWPDTAHPQQGIYVAYMPGEPKPFAVADWRNTSHPAPLICDPVDTFAEAQAIWRLLTSINGGPTR